MSSTQGTVAELIAQACSAHGVQRVFGVPGGGSSLDLIAAFARLDIQYHLCRTETGATLMAAADAELRNSFGVAITTQGPGLASAMNGLAHAALDRAPVLLISDGWTAAQSAFDTHQVFDQRAMTAPVVKGSTRLESADPAAELAQAIAAMLSAPWGPVHVELTGENARREVAVKDHVPAVVEPELARPEAALTDLLRASRKPVLLVGLEAREQGAAASILEMAEQLRCPVLTSYKAKGIVSDAYEGLVGHFTGGAAESPCISAADLIVLVGLDPVELIGKPWPYTAPVIDLALVEHPVHYLEPTARMLGSLSASLRSLLPECRRSEWTADELHGLKQEVKDRLAYQGQAAGMSPEQVVTQAMRAAAPLRPAITVDAGAHMFSAMAFWEALAPGGALISNGLASMGFALPAAIARALAHPELPTIAFTGDGGLMMCAGELATAAQVRARLCVIVFNDAALSLIALKQQGRGMAQAGVSWPRADFAVVARGFGMAAFTADSPESYGQALRQAFEAGGPCLIDVHVDPTGYRAQAKALRG